MHRYRHEDIVLVIMFNLPFEGWLEVQKLLKKAYAPIFGRVVFTGFHSMEGFPREDTWVSCESDFHGRMMYTCFGNVVAEIEAPPTGGYFIIGDDSIFAHCQMMGFDKTKLWYDHDLTPKVRLPPAIHIHCK
jgi:hypothetical protein